MKFSLLIVLLITCVIFGSHTGHRLFYKLDLVIENPMLLLDFSRGFEGLSSHGATLGVLIAVYVFTLFSGLRYLEILDYFSLSAATGATLVRAGNLMNSEIVGRKTDIPWAFCFPRYDGDLVPRHPSQIYEIAIGLTVIIALFFYDRLNGRKKKDPGMMTGIFMALYFSLRFFVEFFKEHHVLAADFPLTMGQILSIPFLLSGILLIRRSMKNRSTGHIRSQDSPTR